MSEHVHSWVTCHGTTYCRDCDAKRAPADSRPRSWQAREIYAKWARLDHKEMPENFVAEDAYDAVCAERDTLSEYNLMLGREMAFDKALLKQVCAEREQLRRELAQAKHALKYDVDKIEAHYVAERDRALEQEVMRIEGVLRGEYEKRIAALEDALKDIAGETGTPYARTAQAALDSHMGFFDDEGTKV